MLDAATKPTRPLKNLAGHALFKQGLGPEHPKAQVGASAYHLTKRNPTSSPVSGRGTDRENDKLMKPRKSHGENRWIVDCWPKAAYTFKQI